MENNSSFSEIIEHPPVNKHKGQETEPIYRDPIKERFCCIVCSIYSRDMFNKVCNLRRKKTVNVSQATTVFIVAFWQFMRPPILNKQSNMNATKYGKFYAYFDDYKMPLILLIAVYR